MQHNPLIIIASFLGGMVTSFLIMTMAPATGPKDFVPVMSMDMATTTHATHPMLSVDPTLPVPTVSLAVIPDTKDGYTLHLVTENYTFTPELAGQAPVQGQGHAHLYINGAKVARLYSNWYHLAASELRPGQNAIEVTLNANDHSEWLNGDTHIAATMTVLK